MTRKERKNENNQKTQKMKENPSAPLELYIGFTSLPTFQVAALMESMSNLYGLLAEPDLPPWAYDLDDYYLVRRKGMRRHARSELCLDFARSGNSINFRFSGRNAFPRIKWDGDEVDVEIPATIWTAAVLGVGALILGSQKIYDKYLDIQARQAQVRTENLRGDLLEAEIAKVRAETEEVKLRMKGKRSSPSARGSRLANHRAIINNVNVFHSVISEENIQIVNVNGLPLKDGGRLSTSEDAPDTP